MKDETIVACRVCGVVTPGDFDIQVHASWCTEHPLTKALLELTKLMTKTLRVMGKAEFEARVAKVEGWTPEQSEASRAMHEDWGKVLKKLTPDPKPELTREDAAAENARTDDLKAKLEERMAKASAFLFIPEKERKRMEPLPPGAVLEEKRIKGPRVCRECLRVAGNSLADDDRVWALTNLCRVCEQGELDVENSQLRGLCDRHGAPLRCRWCQVEHRPYQPRWAFQDRRVEAPQWPERHPGTGELLKGEDD